MTNNIDYKSFILIFLVIIIFFVIPAIWHKYKNDDISQNNTFSIARITKKTGSLKNGYHWHYTFKYKDGQFEGYESVHKDYKVQSGEYYVVNFSKKNPEYNKILYKYKIDKAPEKLMGLSWDSIPHRIISNK